MGNSWENLSFLICSLPVEVFGSVKLTKAVDIPNPNLAQICSSPGTPVKPRDGG